MTGDKRWLWTVPCEIERRNPARDYRKAASEAVGKPKRHSAQKLNFDSVSRKTKLPVLSKCS